MALASKFVAWGHYSPEDLFWYSDEVSLDGLQEELEKLQGQEVRNPLMIVSLCISYSADEILHNKAGNYQSKLHEGMLMYVMLRRNNEQIAQELSSGK